MKRLARISFLLFPNIEKLSKFQREEYSRLWFNLSLLIFGSLVIKIFEPGSQKFDFYAIGAILLGLTGFFICVKVGLYISTER